MEAAAQSLFSLFPSNPTQPLLHKPLKSSSVYFNKSHKLDSSYKTHYLSKLVSQNIRTQARLVCRNSVGSYDLVRVEEEGGDSLVGIQRKKLAVFVSGGGSKVRSIHEAGVQGSVNGYIAVLVTSKPGCGGAEYARNNGIPAILVSHSSVVPEGVSISDLVTALRSGSVRFCPKALEAFRQMQVEGVRPASFITT